jgi:hypothetical protein
MRRTVTAFFTVAVAMLLSLSLAVPASAADLWSNSSDPKFKYGLDYWKYATQGGGNGPAGPSSPLSSAPSKLNVPSSVNPSNTGGNWYLRNQKDKVAGTRSVNPADKPLTGKIIEPGKTLVRVPSTYAPLAKYAGPLIGVSKLLGSVGIGMGGTSQAPANSNEIAVSQGVSQACLDSTAPGTCTSDEIKKKFMIDSCGINGTCDSIGAVGVDGDPLSEWFKTDALPFLEDFWAKLTGQERDDNSEPLPNARGHFDSVPRACYRSIANVSFLDGGGAKISVTGTVTASRDSMDLFGRDPWDSYCSPSALLKTSNMEGMGWKTTCVDVAGGRDGMGAFRSVRPSSGQPYGKEGSFLPGSWVGPDTDPVKQNGVSICSDPVGSEQLRPLKIAFRQTFDQSETRMAAMEYSEYWNRLVEVQEAELVEDEKVTTTVDCQTPDGQVFTLSQTVGKVAAFVAPECPVGSDLIRHEISTSVAGGDSNVIDAGASVPGAAAAYPDCMGGRGCTLAVHLDGSACVSTRSDCSNWPAVAASAPSRVECKWGTYTVPVSDCYSLSNAYKSETGVIFDPNSGVWTAIDNFGNPVAPNPEPWNPVNPTPAVGVEPGAAPGTGTGTGTGTGSAPMPVTGTAPAAAANTDCSTRPWSWNPTEWVQTPVVCALEQAFVPKTDVQARITELQQLTVGKPPLSWISPPITGPGGTGCPNWVVTVPGFSKNVVCESSFTSAILSARPAMFGILATAMVWPFFRSRWYSAIPILRVTPSSSK